MLIGRDQLRSTSTPVRRYEKHPTFINSERSSGDIETKTSCKAYPFHCWKNRLALQDQVKVKNHQTGNSRVHGTRNTCWGDKYRSYTMAKKNGWKGFSDNGLSENFE